MKDERRKREKACHPATVTHHMIYSVFAKTFGILMWLNSEHSEVKLTTYNRVSIY